MSHRSQHGFTLVELLLALTLMAILMALAYGGLKAAARASESGTQRLDDTLSMRATHQFIRRQINQMQPLPFGFADDLEDPNVVFEGNAQGIRFVAPMPGYLGQGGPQVQQIVAVRGDDGMDLLFNHALLLGFDPALGFQRDPVLLMEGLESVQFEFLARDEQGELIGWTQAWVTPNLLPVAVSLDIDPGEESPLNWPLLTAGVRVDELSTTASGAAQSYSEAIRNMIQGNNSEGQ
ncbi:MAG: prepilin-type N-terminal cleavage/methylation domain-containing protein [Xanthomonadales bacterium]|nr:prepilin-type N-terminal cleavage/methylation domain-containing protein [Xanthomonadales bacterium]